MASNAHASLVHAQVTMVLTGLPSFTNRSFSLCLLVLLALPLTTTPGASGQSGDQSSDGQATARPGSQPPRSAPPAGRQGTAQPRQTPRQSPPQNPRQSPPQSPPHARQPHATPPPQSQPRQGAPRGAPPASGQTARPREEPRHHPPVAGPLRHAYPEPRFYGYDRPRVVVPIITYPHPYYSFYPRFWIGFGIYVGVPIPYPIVYGYPPYVYGDGVIYAAPTDNSMYGGIAFTITPDDASVAVDGVYVGIARDFSSRQQPLTLTPGRHHIELQASDRVPLAFDVEIHAGEVLPFQGTLQSS